MALNEYATPEEVLHAAKIAFSARAYEAKIIKDSGNLWGPKLTPIREAIIFGRDAVEGGVWDFCLANGVHLSDGENQFFHAMKILHDQGVEGADPQKVWEIYDDVQREYGIADE